MASMIAPPAGRIRARIGLIRKRAEASAAGSTASSAWMVATRSRVNIRSAMASGSTLTRFDAVPPTAMISLGSDAGAAGMASAAAARIASTSVGVGGSAVANRSVKSWEPSRTPPARGRWTGSTTQNSELPPPTSTTNVSRPTGIPWVTPMIVRNASSSCDRTCSDAPSISCAAATTRPASAARRIGSVPRKVMASAPNDRATAANRASVARSSSRASLPRKPRRATVEPRPRNADSSASGSRSWPTMRATRRWTEFDPRSTDAPTTPGSSGPGPTGPAVVAQAPGSDGEDFVVRVVGLAVDAGRRLAVVALAAGFGFAAGALAEVGAVVEAAGFRVAGFAADGRLVVAGFVDGFAVDRRAVVVRRVVVGFAAADGDDAPAADPRVFGAGAGFVVAGLRAAAGFRAAGFRAAGFRVAGFRAAGLAAAGVVSAVEGAVVVALAAGSLVAAL